MDAVMLRSATFMILWWNKCAMLALYLLVSDSIILYMIGNVHNLDKLEWCE